MDQNKTILIIENSDVSVYNFRKELIEKIISENYNLYLASPDGSKLEDLKALGIDHLEINVDRRGTNPIKDFSLYRKLKKTIKKLNPDLVLTYTIKPNIYGSLAAKKLKIPHMATITGLGTAVEDGGLVQKVILFLYKRAFKKINNVFFQNTKNKNFFKEKKVIKDNYLLVPGSGVNLNRFKYIPYPEEKEEINVLFLGRLMANKGVDELIEAIEIIKNQNDNINFFLVGDYEEEKYDLKLKEMEEKGLLKYYGVQNDVRPYLKEAHVLINPSYHEGLSNVLLEASASGRPVLASNISGCKETFTEGITGFGFQVKSVNAIVETINKFSLVPYEEKVLMGKKAREKVENEFDRNIVVNMYLEKIKEILKE